ncbi:hypothetical protein POM88_040214 [Heracleum sosnowskyi]|uniref:Response regulatory domain-containing protein n=1 Tax=Heracleum sosnowskyi TaxID=360622 RepID=A0AAD8MA32_9APIA|nr:hypothetical protein POM88_040214 [Heracleum sosnowskyi]
MGHELELKGRMNDMVGLDVKEEGGDFREPVAKNMICASNYQDDIFDLEGSMHEQALQVDLVEKSGVKIMECAHQSDNPQERDASQDTTEYSSSFGTTASGDENDDFFSDSEVMSKLLDNGFGQHCRMRKKRLTSHWRTFIQPYMWRCRWAELQIRRLMYQASKYDLQAEAISRRKQLTSEDLTVDYTGAKSPSISGGMRREKIMERRKRKRVEESTDKEAYMAQHNLFSYIGSKRTSTDFASINDWANLGILMDKKINVGSMLGPSDESAYLEFRNKDNSWEQILWNIEVLQSHLNGLKTRFKMVLSENTKEINYADMLKLCTASTGFPQSNASTSEGKKLVQSSGIASQPMPKFGMSGSAISAHGERANLAHMITCKDELHIQKPCENEGDGHLTYNSTTKELNNIVKVEIQPTEKLGTLNEEQANIVPSVPVAADDQPTSRIRSVSKLTSPNNKRKRGRRKAGKMAFEVGDSSGSNSTCGNENNSTENTRMSITALVVDDDQDAIRAFIELLQRYGYETSVVNSGTQAIDLIHSGNQFDVIFLEMKNSLNGLQTTRDLRAIGVRRMIIGMEVPISRRDYQDVRDSGLNIFYAKPVSHVSVAMLHNEIEKKKRAAEYAEA